MPAGNRCSFDSRRRQAVVVMLVGSCLWAYVIATLCAVLAAASKDSEGFYEGLEQLQMLLRKRHVREWETGQRKQICAGACG